MKIKTGRILLLIVMAGVMMACGGKDKKNERRIIPQNDLVPVLEDIYLADGIFSMSSLRKQFPGTDSLSNYRDVLAKYGYTVGDLEKTIDYYNTPERLKELEKVYEQVIKDLNILQEKTFEEEQRGPQGMRDTTDLWLRKRSFSLPRDGQRNKIPFIVPVRGQGIYTLTLRVKVYANDGSRRPTIHLWFLKSGDSREVKIEWPRERLPKDGKWHQYVLAKRLTDPGITHLKGYLLDDENKDAHYIKRAEVKDIRLEVKPSDLSKKIPFMK